MSGEKNIYKKLATLKESVPYIQKQAKQYMKFKVVTSEDVLTAIQPTMQTLGLILEPHIKSKEVTRLPIGTHDRTKKTIFSYLVDLSVVYRWVNIENPSEVVDVEFAAIAEDENASYAFGQAMTYAEKTFVLKYFNIPTDDSDPDIFQQQLMKRIPAEPAQIESLEILVDKMYKLTKQPKEAIREQAKITSNINIEKGFDQFSAHDHGLVANCLNGWVIAYEKKQAKEKKAQKEES